MNTEHVYRVIVTREDGAWLADVPELEGAHTYARTLPALDRGVREIHQQHQGRRLVRRTA